jgi:hypothetical protein
MATISNARLHINPDSGKQYNECVGIVTYSIKGISRLVPAGTIVLAHFGSFCRANHGYVEYSATLLADYGNICHNYDSEFCDDLAALRAGNVEIVH